MRSGENLMRVSSIRAMLWMAVVSAVLLAGSVYTQAGMTARQEYEVKAAFIYNFARFVDWPPGSFPEAGSTISLCVLGPDPFGHLLDETFQQKSIDGRSFLIRRSHKITDMQNCHIVFIGTSDEEHLPDIFEELEGSKILTIGEVDGFACQGGIINFAKRESKIRFEINVDSARSADLRISSRLLSLATVLKGNCRR